MKLLPLLLALCLSCVPLSPLVQYPEPWGDTPSAHIESTPYYETDAWGHAHQSIRKTLKLINPSSRMFLFDVMCNTFAMHDVEVPEASIYSLPMGNRDYSCDVQWR